MRVLFFGTSAFAVPSLEAVAAGGHTIVLCVTQPDRPRGRGLSMAPSPVKQAARHLGVPLMQPETLQPAAFEALHPDVGVVVAYGRLVKRDVLAVAREGMLGVHPSLLPKYRGAAPIARALLNGETTTGVTIFRLNEALDAGEIASQRVVPIAASDNAQTLGERLGQLGAEELARVLKALEAHQLVFTAQDASQATMAPKFSKADGQIDWSQPAERIARLVRAAVPWPGASTGWQGTPLKIWSASIEDAAETSIGKTPGTVLQVSPETITVATGSGTLGLTEVQPAGRRRMLVREFLAGHRLQIGDRFV